MSNITGKIAKKVAVGALAVAAVAAGDTAVYAVTSHASIASHASVTSSTSASADNNNPGPDSTTPAPPAA